MKRFLEWLEGLFSPESANMELDALSQMPVEEYHEMLERIFNFSRKQNERNSNGESSAQHSSSDRP